MSLYKKELTDNFYKAFVMNDHDEQFNIWLDDSFNPNDTDCFQEPLIMNILTTYATSNTLKIEESDFKETVNLLIGHGDYDPNQTNEFLETPLFYVARHKSLNCVAKALMGIDGTKLALKNDVGINMFEIAIMNGNYEFAEMLLNTGKFDFMTSGQAEIREKTKNTGHAQ